MKWVILGKRAPLDSDIKDPRERKETQVPRGLLVPSQPSGNGAMALQWSRNLASQVLQGPLDFPGEMGSRVILVKMENRARLVLKVSQELPVTKVLEEIRATQGLESKDQEDLPAPLDPPAPLPGLTNSPLSTWKDRDWKVTRNFIGVCQDPVDLLVFLGSRDGLVCLV